MPLDFIILDNDEIQLTFPPPTQIPALEAPVPLTARGFSTVNGAAVCVEGDELPPSLQSELPYTSGNFTTPGMGTLSLTLGATNKTQVAKDKNKAILLKGQTFTATFTVKSPAIQPGPSATPDPVSQKTVTAEFVTKNSVAKAE